MAARLIRANNIRNLILIEKDKRPVLSMLLVVPFRENEDQILCKRLV